MGRSSLRAAAAVTVAGVLSASAAHAQTWTPTAAGTYAWNDDANWSAAFPNAAGAVANINNDISGNQTITVPGGDGITVGTLNIGDSGAAPDSRFQIGNNGAGTLIFDNGANDAQINADKTLAHLINDDDVIGANILLNSNLVVTVPAPTGDKLRINGNIADGANGPKTITFNTAGWVELGNGSGLGNTYTGATIATGTGRLRLASGGGSILVPGNLTIDGGATVQDSNGNGNAIADTAQLNLLQGFYNLGGGSETVGSIEGTGANSDSFEIGGGAGTLTFGGNNLDKTYNGRIGYDNSYTKVGTGAQTLGGTLHNWSNGTRSFNVLGGRVDLNKTAGVANIAQVNLNVGNGTQSGLGRPELRLLQSDQIVVRTFSGTPAETTVMTLNSGVFNTDGNDESIGTARVDESALAVHGASTIDLGDGDSVLRFGDSSAAAWTGTLEVLDWSGLPTGGGTDQFFVGTDQGGLTAAQLAAISFVDPDGFAPGTYAAQQLSTGEVVAVPEPAAIGLLGLGGVALLARRRRA